MGGGGEETNSVQELLYLVTVLCFVFLLCKKCCLHNKLGKYYNISDYREFSFLAFKTKEKSESKTRIDEQAMLSKL